MPGLLEVIDLQLCTECSNLQINMYQYQSSANLPLAPARADHTIVIFDTLNISQ